jgi:hypothetical protein
MAIAVRQEITFHGNGDTVDVPYDSDILSGSLLVALVNAYQTGTEAFNVPSDTQTNTWVELYDNNYQNQDAAQVAYVVNASAGATTVTIDATGGGPWYGVVLYEISGIKTSAALDQSNNATGSSNSAWASGSITTTENDEIMIAFMCQDDTAVTQTLDAAFTLTWNYETQSSNMPMNAGYKIVSSTETEENTGTISGSNIDYYAAIISFEMEAAAPTVLPFIHKNINQAVNRSGTY